MTCVGANTRDLQMNSSFVNCSAGDELPSLSCDLGDVNSTEFEQLLLGGLLDPCLLDIQNMQLGASTVEETTLQHHSEASCDLTSFFLEDVARPRDLNLTFPGDFNHGIGLPENISSSMQMQGGMEIDSPNLPMIDDNQMNLDQKTEQPSFFHPDNLNTVVAYQEMFSSSSAISAPWPISTFDRPTSGCVTTPHSGGVISSRCVTPPHSGGVTPPGGSSRAPSPALSESSGYLSGSSLSSAKIKFDVGCRQRSRHHSRSSVSSTASNGGGSSYGIDMASSCSTSDIPRHKRPSHKRAEVKRRDKIKTCLDDMKEAIPSLREKGKLSESAILIKATEYVRHLKDGQTERGKKSAELQQEIDSLSEEIHSFQENLPAAGLKEERVSSASLDYLYQEWLKENTKNSQKFWIFSAITSKMWGSFKEIVGPALSLDALSTTSQEWQAKSLALTVIRKQILNGLLSLSRQDNILMGPDLSKMDLGTSVDAAQL